MAAVLSKEPAAETWLHGTRTHTGLMTLPGLRSVTLPFGFTSKTNMKEASLLH